MTDRVLVEMTIDQSRAVVDGLDFSSRMPMGQIDELATMARTGQMRVRDDAAPGGSRTATYEEADAIEEHARAIARILGHGIGSSFGIRSPGVPDAAKHQYEVKKAVESALAHHLQPGGWTCAHDGVTVRATSAPVPTARIESAAR